MKGRWLDRHQDWGLFFMNLLFAKDDDVSSNWQFAKNRG